MMRDKEPFSIKVGDEVVVMDVRPAKLSGEQFPFSLGQRLTVLEVSPAGYAVYLRGDYRFWHIARFEVVPRILN